MSEIQRSGSVHFSRPLYFAARLCPPTATFLLAYFDLHFPVSAVFLVILTIIEFRITNDHFAFGPIGLRWYFSFTDSHGFPFVVYTSKPLPFIAPASDSNAFWIGMIVPIVIGVIGGLVIVFLRGLEWWILVLGLAVGNALNFVAFLKCKNIGSEEADTAAKNILLDTAKVAFQAANDAAGDEGQSDEDDDEIV
jgi:hypothetical protein